METIWILYLGIFLSLCVTMTVGVGVSEMANLLIKTYIKKEPIPLISQSRPNLDMKTAYQVQKAYVQQRVAKEGLAGFKAALTTDLIQKKFGVNFPVTGILYTSGRLEGSPIMDRKDGLMIETEIGFVIGQSIKQPVRDIQELQQKVTAIMPAIELPELDFVDMKALKVVDLVAANVCAARFITGTPRSHLGVNLNEVNVTLYYNGQALYQGKGVDALGDQWGAISWLVNSVVEQGYKVEPGHIIITGALGQMVPGKPGQYIADYADFGKISFEVK
jgi:2-keto-4-pentenoate hydratase